MPSGSESSQADTRQAACLNCHYHVLHKLLYDSLDQNTSCSPQPHKAVLYLNTGSACATVFYWWTDIESLPDTGFGSPTHQIRPDADLAGSDFSCNCATAVGAHNKITITANIRRECTAAVFGILCCRRGGWWWPTRSADALVGWVYKLLTTRHK